LSSLTELAQAVTDLKGCRVTDLGRTVNMAEVGLRRGDAIYRLHAQCPFRVVRGNRILLGSVDMAYPAERNADAKVAYEMRTTMYDRNAQLLTNRLSAGDFPVIEAEMNETGAFFFEIPDSVRFEIFPACSGAVEGWRLFRKGSDVHYVYPDSADRD
jgi:hypothetical protein